MSFKTKNKKLKNLIRLKKQVVIKHHSGPIINISKFVLSSKKEEQLKFCLNHSLVDKSKNIKMLLAPNMERSTEKVGSSLDLDQLENFHEFMSAYTDIFTNIANIFTNNICNQRWLISQSQRYN